MKRRNGFIRKLYAAALIVVCFAAGGCGDSGNVKISEADFMKALLEQVQFDCELYQVTDEGVAGFFDMPENASAIMYMGSGAYADSAAVFTAADRDGAGQILKEVKAYTEDLRASFEDYIPEEAAKIDGAVVEQKGNYVVLCITSDDGAKSFIEDYFGQSQGDGLQGDDAQATDALEEPSREDGEPLNVESDQQTQTDAAKPEADDSAKAELEKYPYISQEGKLKDYGNVVAVGDTAYELYSYSAGAAEKYAAAINSTADALKGKTRVIDLMIPLSSGITLPDDLYGEISSSSQKKALKSLTKKMNDNVIVVNPYDNLMKHRDEYIYFRTDHHWTADGAYYAYEELCKATGMDVIPREKRETVDFGGFLGSFYKDTGESKALKENPDTVRAYYPVSENTSLTYTTTEGRSNSWKVIWDVSDYGASMKYSTFIAGDNPYTVIQNGDLEGDGSVCVVVKESFGNALVPFLVDHYEKIYVIDYRYWQGDLTEFTADKNADELYFFNNLSMIRSDYLVGKLAAII